MITARRWLVRRTACDASVADAAFALPRPHEHTASAVVIRV